MTASDACRPHRSRPYGCLPARGFTLIELLVAMSIVGVLAAIAIPTFQGLRERAMVAAAIAEIASMQQEITEFWLINDRYPTSLTEVGLAGSTDPWGRPYRYLDHTGASNGAKRKDRFLVPVNSDFDLYSMGANGLTVVPFPPPASQDDIVRANNGGYIGLASEF